MLDPVSFKPYDPRADYRAEAVPDILPGYDANTDRVSRDMRNVAEAEAANDKVRTANMVSAAKDLERLGTFSKTIAELGQKATEEYIELEKSAAVAQKLSDETAIPQQFLDEEKQLQEQGVAEDTALTDKVSSGEVSPITAANYKNRSIWFQYEYAKQDISSKSADFATFLKVNATTEVMVNGVPMTLETAESLSQVAAIQNELLLQFTQQTGLGRYRSDLVAEHGRKNINQAKTASSAVWAEAKAQQVKVEQLNQDAAAVASMRGVESASQSWSTKFGRSAAMRQRGAKALVQAVENGQLTVDEALGLLNGTVTTGGGTKPLSEMFPAELGSLKEKLEQKRRTQRQQDRTDKQLEAQEWMDAQRDRLRELREQDVYLTPAQEAELIQQGRDLGLSDAAVNGIVINTSEKAAQDAELQAQQFISRNEELPESVFSLLDARTQKLVEDRGLAPQTFAIMPDKDTIKAADKYVVAQLSQTLGDAAGDPQDRTPEFILASERSRDLYQAYYAEAREQGQTVRQADETARSRTAELINSIPTDTQSPEYKSHLLTRPLSGSIDATRADRTQQLVAIVDDNPERLNTEVVFKPEELEAAKKALERGDPIPWEFQYIAAQNPKGTARQLAEQQLSLAGINYTPKPAPGQEAILAATPEQFRPLIEYRPTAGRVIQAQAYSQGQTPNSPSMLTSQVRSMSGNLNNVERAALDAIGKYESDTSGGYNAVNQIGLAGGHSTGEHLGAYSGPYSGLGGRNLTDMTVGEIMDLQARRSMSNAEWIRQGRLHAVGRYQFIRDTFAAVIQQLGISPNEKFSPQLQDRMALHLLRTSANGIGQWVGPDSYASAQERSIIAQARRM